MTLRWILEAGPTAMHSLEGQMSAIAILRTTTASGRSFYETYLGL